MVVCCCQVVRFAVVRLSASLLSKSHSIDQGYQNKSGQVMLSVNIFEPWKLNDIEQLLNHVERRSLCTLNFEQSCALRSVLFNPQQ